MKQNPTQLGISLIELMISILLGSFIILGSMQAYIGSRQVSGFSEGITIIQENSRFILDELNSGIRQASEIGCPSKHVRHANQTLAVNDDENTPRLIFNSVASNNSGGEVWFTHFYRGIEGYTGADASNSFLAGMDAINDSDVFIIHRLEAGSSAKILVHDPSSATFESSPNGFAHFQTGNILMVVRNNCSEASMFLASSASENFITHKESVPNSQYKNCSQGLSTSTSDLTPNTHKGSLSCRTQPAPANESFGTHSVLAKVTTSAYFVQLKDNSYNLMRLSAGDEEPDELISGVERMVVKFGIDRDDDNVANQYLRQSEISPSEWVNVVTVRIGLIMVNPKHALNEPESVSCEGYTSQKDTFLRRCVTTTINIRSRSEASI